MALTTIHDEAGVRALADHLNGDQRRRPVALVTTPAGRSAPWVDVAELEAAFGDAVDVYVLPTGPLTYALSEALPDGTQACGGAGRVYPVGHDWTRDRRQSPLHFSLDAASGAASTRALVADGLRMALACGSLVLAAERPTSRRAGGTVKGVVSSRALVELDDRTLASVDEQLTVPGVPLARVVRKGMRVEGVFDPTTRRLDVHDAVRPPETALAAWRAGDVVPALVGEVEADRARLTVYPGISTVVTRDDVTGNPLDDLRTLLTTDDVVAARVVALGPAWRLSLLDVDDDEEVTPAPAVLADGPPWLDPPADDPWHAPAPGPDRSASDAMPPEAPLVVVPDPVVPSEPLTATEPAPPAAPAARGPSPLMFDRRRREEQPPAARPPTRVRRPTPSLPRSPLRRRPRRPPASGRAGPRRRSTTPSPRSRPSCSAPGPTSAP